LKKVLGWIVGIGVPVVLVSGLLYVGVPAIWILAVVTFLVAVLAVLGFGWLYFEYKLALTNSIRITKMEQRVDDIDKVIGELLVVEGDGN
jgi:hypothetical protein